MAIDTLTVQFIEGAVQTVPGQPQLGAVHFCSLPELSTNLIFPTIIIFCWNSLTVWRQSFFNELYCECVMESVKRTMACFQYLYSISLSIRSIPNVKFNLCKSENVTNHWNIRQITAYRNFPFHVYHIHLPVVKWFGSANFSDLFTWQGILVHWQTRPRFSSQGCVICISLAGCMYHAQQANSTPSPNLHSRPSKFDTAHLGVCPCTHGPYECQGWSSEHALCMAGCNLVIVSNLHLIMRQGSGVKEVQLSMVESSHVSPIRCPCCTRALKRPRDSKGT